MAGQPTVNGFRVSFASVALKLSAQGASALDTDLVQFTDVSYKTTVERAEVPGAGRSGQGFTAGRVKHEGSFKISFEEHRKLATALGEGFLDTPITLSVFVQYRGETHTDTITGYMKETGAGFNGTEGTVIDVPLDVSQILYDGKQAIVDTVRGVLT